MTSRDLRPVRRATDDAGFTLIELLVTMSIAVVVLFAILQSADVFARSTARADDVTKAQDAARSTMREITNAVRAGRLPSAADANAGATPAISLAPTGVPSSPVRVADATNGDLIVATTVPSGSSTVAGWTRYCADGSGSLYVAQLASATYATPGACGTSTAGWTSGRALDRTLVGSRSQVFAFDSGACVAGRAVGTGGACTPAAGSVTTVGLRLAVAGKPGTDLTTADATLRDAVNVRNGSPK